MTAFDLLWADASDPSDRDNDERRDLAEHFFEHGEKSATARIRKLALDEAERIAISGPVPPYEAGYLEREAKALRDFAALLEDKP